MEALSDNMYKQAIDDHRKVIISTMNAISKNQPKRNTMLLFDFDVYSKGVSFENSLFLVYIDSLPDYCSSRYHLYESCICIKHLDLFVLTSA